MTKKASDDEAKSAQEVAVEVILLLHHVVPERSRQVVQPQQGLSEDLDHGR